MMATSLATRPAPSNERRSTTTSLLERFGTSSSAFLAIVAASAFLGAVVSRSATVATLHLLVTLGSVLFIGLTAKSPAPILAIIIYAGTCDVFWRSAAARGPWEGAKYALIFGFAFIAIRFVRRPRNASLAIGLLVLLIPGVVVGVASFGPLVAREYVVANLAGLIALALGTLVCTNLRVSEAEARGVYLLALSPAVSIAAIAAIATATSSDLGFGTESNFAAAGGFGPVQVSSVLCFGALLCILVMLQSTAPSGTRILALATGTWLVGQAVLTFSRGGVFSLVLAVAAIGLTSFTLSGQRGRTVIAVGLLVVVALQIMSWAGAFTDGASEERFASTDSTNRSTLARADLELFLEHPLLGVGVGQAKYKRDFPVQAAPHTEYSRLLAEHGIFGLGVLVALGVLSFRMVQAGTGWWRMAAVGLIVMTLTQMAHSATRIGCIALGFALAGLREEEPRSAA